MGLASGDMSRSATVAFLRLFSYVALAIGVLAALNGTRLLVGLLFWPASAPPWVLPAFNLGVATLAIGVGSMVRYALENPSTYGGSQAIRDKWKQW